MAPKNEEFEPAEIKSGKAVSNADIIPDAGKVHLGKSTRNFARVWIDSTVRLGAGYIMTPLLSFRTMFVSAMPR